MTLKNNKMYLFILVNIEVNLNICSLVYDNNLKSQVYYKPVKVFQCK